METLKKEKSQYHVSLRYSSDNIPSDKEWDKLGKLYKGGDLVTKILNYFNVPYELQLAYDFHHDEPLLERVLKKDKNGKAYTLYNSWRDIFTAFWGEYSVLDALEAFGVIPCSVEDAIKLVGGEK